MRVPGTNIPLILDTSKEEQDPTKKKGEMMPARFRVGPVGIATGSVESRRKMAENMGQYITPELWDLMTAMHKKGKRMEGVSNFLGNLATYAGTEAIVSTAAAIAVPGLGLPAVAPFLAVKRIHDISIARRSELSKSPNRWAKPALHLYNTAFSPLDLSFYGMYKTMSAFSSIWRGNGPVADFVVRVGDLDKDLSNIKVVDGGFVNKALNFGQRLTDSLTFGATASPQKSAA